MNEKIPDTVEGCVEHPVWNSGCWLWNIRYNIDKTWIVSRNCDDAMEEKVLGSGKTLLEACQKALRKARKLNSRYGIAG